MKSGFDLGYTLQFSCLADNKLSVKSYFISYCITVNGSWNEILKLPRSVE